MRKDQTESHLTRQVSEHFYPGKKPWQGQGNCSWEKVIKTILFCPMAPKQRIEIAGVSGSCEGCFAEDPKGD